MFLAGIFKKNVSTSDIPEYEVLGDPNARVCKCSISGTKSPLELILQGTALGDSAGQPYEGTSGSCIPKWFSNGKSGLYKPGCHITDDTILSAATAYALKNHIPFGNTYASYAKNYPAAYGQNFYQWVQNVNRKPYNSSGNGSAMRSSPVAVFSSDLDECDSLAEKTAIPTHNHEDGIKGAVVIAHMVFLALYGGDKSDIVAYGTSRYPSAKCGELTPGFLCNDTLPIVIRSFAKTETFEDCVRMAICFGGDTDTQGAIAGALAGAYYKRFSDESETKWEEIRKSIVFCGLL